MRITAKLPSICRPNHVITLIPPKWEKQVHDFATFIVPLKFNKLDMRDYLYHVYGVEVKSVRSFINPAGPQQKDEDLHNSGRWYRPLSQKMMKVELVKPFVYPELPEDLGPWEQKLYDRIIDERKTNLEAQRERTRKARLVIDKPAEPYRIQLAKQAQALLRGDVKWDNKRQLDEKWSQDVQQPAETQNKGPVSR